MAKSNHLSWLLLLTFICIHFDIIGYSLKDSLEPEIKQTVGQARKEDNFGIRPIRNSLNKRVREDYFDIIARVKQVYDSQIGVKESGWNSGPDVEQYLRYVNLPKGNPWCAAFVCWVFGKAGIANPRTGWTPSLFPVDRVIWVRAESGKLKVESTVEEQRAWSKEQGHVPYTYPTRQAIGNRQQITPSTGDVFGIYFPEKKRIAHVGFIDSWDGTWLITVEGNTNTSGNLEGDGVYRKRRPVRSIYRVARYINY